MSFLETLKTGITGYSPEEQAELDAARAEARETARQLKEQARKKRLEQAKERIRQSPYTEPAKRKAFVQKVEAGAKKLAVGAYQGISGFGAPPNPQARTGAQQAIDAINPFDAFGAAWIGSRPAPRAANKAKKAKAYDPWQGLR